MMEPGITFLQRGGQQGRRCHPPIIIVLVQMKCYFYTLFILFFLRLGLTIDNVNVIQKQAPPITRQEEKFKGCVANLYTRRLENVINKVTYSTCFMQKTHNGI